MPRLRRMQEKCGRTGTRKRGGNLPRDVPGLAYPGDDHAAFAREAEATGLGEAAIDLRQQGLDRFGFNRERLARIAFELRVGDRCVGRG